ncbi:MAG TPA: hypothetical protein VEK11_08180 [Thermoanaerobaculia bacterium]|nr:hypothetical protein [Thermoanaerobaculia bacterium]
MICPECETEYREGFSKCADCDVALVRELHGETGEDIPASLEPLAHESSAELVAELLDHLERAGVPYVIQAGTALAVFEGATPTTGHPLEWEARVWVIDTFKREAQRILDEVRAAEAQKNPGLLPPLPRYTRG